MVEVANEGRSHKEWWWRERTYFSYRDHVLQTEISIANHEVICEIENLLQVPAVYHALFYRTKMFATTVQDLVTATKAAQTPYPWAMAACLLIDWSVDVLRHKKVEFETFLHSQRESLYWILDDALLRILSDQWEDTTSNTPWDLATAPLLITLSKAQSRIPEWADQDLEGMLRWKPYMYNPKEILLDSYFKRSQSFLRQSARIHEIWRAVRIMSNGRLPAELENAIVEDVSKFEGLPTASLKKFYFPKMKCKAKS
ncbi:hypothetical protein BKA66DRAFT_421792 [Pyrenochaeta sp. MPI-SDFR-AT-0127]|nr:hypothetical protein BKA66DRAFT_421792 [Pyrenochaeta sp. MPI-SDFR-AT-0127]